MRLKQHKPFDGRPDGRPDGTSDGTSDSRPDGASGGGRPPQSEPRASADGNHQAEQEAVRCAEADLLSALEGAWSRGWLPGEVIRQVARAQSPEAATLAGLAVVADHARRPAETLHPHWVSHVGALTLPPAGVDWLLAFQRQHHLTVPRCLHLARSMVQIIGWLRPLGVVIPGPGASARSESIIDAQARGGVDHGDPALSPILDKVRALLAQAESTTFEAEAETFTAKAQELMARHAIDAALVWGRGTRHDEPAMIRIPVDEPYLSSKTMLLHVVAERSQCKTVYYKGYALAVVVGFAADLAASETLYTSLLVQAQIALQQEAAGSRPGDHVRSRGFRSSFLYAYAGRIGQRLAEVNERVQAQAAARGGTDLLPVLADRASLIQAKISSDLGPVRTSRTTAGMDATGWHAGSRAADRARLGQHEINYKS